MFLSLLNSILLFLNLGGGEVFLIVLVIVLFFGSDKLPGIAKGIGKGIREINNAKDQIQSEIQKSTQEFTNEIKKHTSEVGSEIEKAGSGIQQQVKDAANTLNDEGKQISDTLK